jgi:predicted  nucleic acid-binding Zn-ribbon protein
MTTKNLSASLSVFDALQKQRTDLNTELEANSREQAAAVEVAAGPNDEKALARLAILARQEAALRHKLKILERERSGLAAKVLNEATELRKAVIGDLLKRRTELESRLDQDLAELYPEPKRRKKAIARLNPAPVALHELGRRISGLSSCAFFPEQTDEFSYARQILGACERAIAQCLD